MAQEIDPESLLSFFDETTAALETISAKLLMAEKGELPETGINEIFRAAHTIKGLSGFMGFLKIQKLTHSLETLLDRVRHGKQELNAKAVDASLEAVDCLNVLIQNLKDGEGEKGEISQPLEKLDELVKIEKPDGAPGQALVALGPLPHWLGAHLNEDDALEILIASKQGPVYALHMEWQSVLSDFREPTELFRALESQGRVYASFPIFQGSSTAFSPLEHFHSSIGIVLTCRDTIQEFLNGIDFPATTSWRIGLEELAAPYHHEPNQDLIHLNSANLTIKSGMERHLDMFTGESRDELDTLDSELIAYEAAPQDREHLAAVFRLMHRLKSSCAAMGLTPMATAAHHCESLLAQLRQSGKAPSDITFKALFQAKDFLGQCLDQIQSGGSTVTSTEGLESSLNDALTGMSQAKNPMMTLPQGWEILLSHAHDQGKVVQDIRVYLAPGTPLADLRYAVVLRSASGLGEVIAAIPNLDALENGIEDPGYLHLLLVCDNAIENIRISLHVDMVMKIEITTLSPTVKASNQISVGDGATKSAAEGRVAKEVSKPQSSAVASNTVRVDAGRLDALLNIAGELTIAKSRVTQLTESIGRSLSSLPHYDFPQMEEGERNPLKEANDAVTQLREALLTLNRHIVSLQSGVMQARMVPVGPLFQRFHRLVRDICKDNGKQAHLMTIGEATELDKKLIDELADPITHLVRNSVDHGLEGPAEREAAGKNAQGTVRLEAIHEGGQILIRIGDDGRGLSVEKIKAKAIRMGLIDEVGAGRLSESETHQLIFQPGFSTAAAVTNISGRGVGMDIVRAKVIELKGQIEIQSVSGQGCTFTIRLPLTLAMVDGLLVQVGKTRFLFPVESVQEIVDVLPENCRRVSGIGAFFPLRDQVVALMEMRDLLHSDSRQGHGQDQALRALVLKTSGQSIAVAVDRVFGREEAVIKPLTPEFAQVRGFAGATVLGDGSIALIVDVSSLRDLALKPINHVSVRQKLEVNHV